jgi:hypothetical protein
LGPWRLGPWLAQRLELGGGWWPAYAGLGLGYGLGAWDYGYPYDYGYGYPDYDYDYDYGYGYGYGYGYPYYDYSYGYPATGSSGYYSAAPLVTGRSVATEQLGSYCTSSVKACELHPRPMSAAAAPAGCRADTRGAS